MTDGRGNNSLVIRVEHAHLSTMMSRLAARLPSLLSSAFFVSLTACAGGAPTATLAPAPAPEVVVVFDTVQVPAEPDLALEQRLATLQLQLFEGTAQVANLQRQLEAARQEVVRSMARSQTLASRAEAASAMAEAEIGAQAVSDAAGDEEVAEAAQARQLLGLSTAEFTHENYGGALYLANQARRVARAGEYRLTSGEQTDRQPSEKLFALPVPLETTRRSNVRTGPGLGFRVLVTLDPITPVVGHSYTEQWVRITDDEGRDGWIFHNLVTSRRESER